MRDELRAVLVTAIVTGASAAQAIDVVRMKSGDVVSGVIEEISDDELRIDPAFSDVIEIEFKYIASIQTDRPVRVLFKDGAEYTGYVELDENGKMQIRTAPTRWDVRHADEDDRTIDPENPMRLPAGTREPVGDIRRIRELEVALARYEAEIGMGLNASSGNTESSSVAFDTMLRPEWGPNSLELNAGMEQRTADGELSAKNWRVSLQYERDLPQDWFAWTVGAVESDPFQNLDLRSVLGLGGGYRFFDVDPLHLSVALGPAYVRENFSVAGADREFAAVAWAFHFELDLFSDDFKFYHDHRIFQSFTGPELLFLTTQGIELDVWRDLDLKLEVDYDHTSEPAPGVSEKDDFRYLIKLEFDFEGDERDWFH
jgi:putative salt-induced outer membrane protein YdiY